MERFIKFVIAAAAKQHGAKVKVAVKAAEPPKDQKQAVTRSRDQAPNISA